MYVLLQAEQSGQLVNYFPVTCCLADLRVRWYLRVCRFFLNSVVHSFFYSSTLIILFSYLEEHLPYKSRIQLWQSAYFLQELS